MRLCLLAQENNGNIESRKGEKKQCCAKREHVNKIAIPSKRTVFAYFMEHIALINVQIHRNGWKNKGAKQNCYLAAAITSLLCAKLKDWHC